MASCQSCVKLWRSVFIPVSRMIQGSKPNQEFLELFREFWKWFGRKFGASGFVKSEILFQFFLSVWKKLMWGECESQDGLSTHLLRHEYLANGFYHLCKSCLSDSLGRTCFLLFCYNLFSQVYPKRDSDLFCCAFLIWFALSCVTLTSPQIYILCSQSICLQYSRSC